jgi:hypothetical protein
LVELSENATVDASRGVEQIAQRARRDGQAHDLTLAIDAAKSGFTVHCSAAPVLIAESRLSSISVIVSMHLEANEWPGSLVVPTISIP